MELHADYLQMMLRLLAAVGAGACIGYERSFHGRPAGLRTHVLVCMASAVLMLVTVYEDHWVRIAGEARLDPTRMAQGIMTGIGFLGAGVIMKDGLSVRGLTTAACVWVTACVGAACAIAQWQIVVIGVVLVLILLVFGGPFERAIDRRWPGRPSGPSDQPPNRTRAPGPEM